MALLVWGQSINYKAFFSSSRILTTINMITVPDHDNKDIIERIKVWYKV